MGKVSKSTMINEQLNAETLCRTVGLEIEGYMKDFPEDVKIQHCRIKMDASLRNAHWAFPNRPFGVEIVTDPLDKLSYLDTVFPDIKSHGWGTGRGTASLHVHVDARDFTLKDKVKAAYFAKRVEDVMFLFVKHHRYQSRYCHLMTHGWAEMLERVPFHYTIWDIFRDIHSVVNHYTMVSRFGVDRRPDYYSFRVSDTDRYNWLNIFSSRHTTIEFRLFHAIKDEVEGKKFAILAHNFIETVKNCSLAHLTYIADRIEEEQDIKKKAEMLLAALNVPFTLPIVGYTAAGAIQSKQGATAVSFARTLEAVGAV